MCVILYHHIRDKEAFINSLRDRFISGIPEVSAIVTMAGDLDSFKKILADINIGFDFFKSEMLYAGYFRGAARNKDSLRWLTTLDIFKTQRRILNNMCFAAAEDPDVIIISKEVFSAIIGDQDPKDYAVDFLDWLMRNIYNRKVRLACYEILFQTGYFNFSFFMNELPRTKELEEWLSYTDI